jgi:uncharacterized protein YaeQ
MAQGATIYVFQVALADSDRGVYENLDLRLARHPSEAPDHMLARLVAYCLEFTEGIAFSSGISEPDEPAIAVRDLVGQLRTWIDVGAPEAARLHRAGKAADRVVVYSHKDPAQWVGRLTGEKIHRAAALEIYALDRDWLAGVQGRLERRMQFALTVAARHLYLSIGAETLSGGIEPIAVPV